MSDRLRRAAGLAGVRRAVSGTRRRRLAAGAAALVVLATATVVLLTAAAGGFRTSDAMVTVRTGPAGSSSVTLDTRLYLPSKASAMGKVPAVLLAHGFGGTKLSVADDAERMARQGYAVLTWTAQGFGRSTGQIHLDAPDWEVSDASRLVDWLAARPEISTQAPGDPRVAVVGGSYGGGLALMLAAADARVDAVVPMITWNDLARSFLPESTGGDPAAGVFKRQWAGLFFGSGGLGSLGAGAGRSAANGGSGGDSGADTAAGDAGGVPGGPPAAALDPQCGRFARDVCEAYLRIAASGRADADAVALLRRSSPASVIDRIRVPTLLIQGTADSLFPLSEADANARAIAANGAPVRVAWFTGGHDGGQGPTSEVDRLHELTTGWLDTYLRGRADTSAAGFSYSRITGLNVTDRGVVTSAYRADTYPGLAGTATVTATVAGRPQVVANPPDGTPGAMSSLPGGGGLASFVSGAVSEIPGQHADFESQPVAAAMDIVGSPGVQIRAASPTGRAVLFVKLYDVDEHGSATLSNGLVAPVRLEGLPTGIEQAAPVGVRLPAIVRRIEAGHRLRITVATSDMAYATPTEPTVYTVAVQPQLSLPTVAARPVAEAGRFLPYLLAGLLGLVTVAVVVAVLIARRARRMAEAAVSSALPDRDPATPQSDPAVPVDDTAPLVVQGLRKAYADGFVAVSSVDFTVGRNQVVGLLGPNGAGKTTTLRVLLGLTRPSGGQVLVFGQRLVPGSPALARVGALVEGPGFVPHLSGVDNLRLYWRSTGRPDGLARFDEALEIAGLGGAVHRKVKTYSHGMRQRLAIAQAMLGLPDLLVLDEPTDGLDPPQIAEMRQVLRRYATGGRSVLVSSHLLAEVEQTCTDVVVMHRGRVVAAGPVDEIVGDAPTVQFDVDDPVAAESVLRGCPQVRSVASSGNGTLVVDMDGAPRAELVARLVTAGIGVERVAQQRRLEDAFLALVGGDTRASGER